MHFELLFEAVIVPNDQDDLAAESQGQIGYRFVKCNGTNSSKGHDGCWKDYHAREDALSCNIGHFQVCLGLPVEVHTLYLEAKDQKSSLDYE